MPKVTLLHNSGAGDENHSGEKLKAAIESQGWQCDYYPFEGKLPVIQPDTDLIAIAGGDGTVRKVVKALLNRRLIDKQFPLTIIPLGTANNLSQFLDIGTDPDLAIESWKENKASNFDVGRVYGMRKHKFFLEGFGFGIFPYLIKRMKDVQEGIDDEPEKKLRTALELLREIVSSYKPHSARVVLDGSDHSGEYILAEVMNSASIGPNLVLAPRAKSDDGTFDVVLISGDQRELLLRYIEAKLNGHEEPLPLEPLRCKQIFIQWKGRDAHVDDKYVDLKSKPEIVIEPLPAALTFMRPERDS